MNFKRLAIFPFLFALIPALIMLGIEDPHQRQIALRIEIETAKTLGLVGSIIAARSFVRGDHLWRAWLLNASCYGFLLFRDLLFGVWLVRDSGEPSAYLEAAIVLIANAGAIAGVWILSRTWQVAGIALPGSHTRREVVRWIGVAVAAACAGPQIYFDSAGALQGNVRAIVFVVSGIGDIFALALIVPVLLTAIALRGGLLRWPWGLMTASQFGWLFYDAVGLLRHFTHLPPTTITMYSEIFRAFACAFCLSAGIAQRAVSDPDAGTMHAQIAA